jgi:hypothetical protein
MTDDLRSKLLRELELLVHGRDAEWIDRLEYLEDSLAALESRDERAAALPWSEVRG